MYALCVIIHKIIRNACILCMIVTPPCVHATLKLQNILDQKQKVILYQRGFMDKQRIFN